MRSVSHRLAAILVMQAAGFLLSACGSEAQDPAPTPPPATDTTAPSVPTGISATAASPTSVVLTWTASTDTGSGATGVGGYRIYRDGGATPVGTSTTATFTDTGLTPNTLYNYTLQAFDKATPANSSGQSAPVSATTPPAAVNDTTPPSVPTNVAAAAVSATQIRVTWSASTDDASGISGYRVYRDGGATPVATVTTTSYTDNAVLPATTHSYTVAAVDGSQNASAQSAAAMATSMADTSPPAMPTNVVAAALSTTSIRVTWSAVSDVSGVSYQVFRADLGAATPLATVTTPSYQNDALTPNTLYTYTVVAVDGAGNASPVSAAASATTNVVPDMTPPSVPTGVTATAQSQTSILVSWTASTDTSGIAGYRVWRNGTAVQTVAQRLTTTTFTDTGLTASTAYSYTVTAIDNSPSLNESAQSTAAMATTPAPPDTTAPNPPTGVSATALSSSSIRVDWTASTDPSGIQEYRVFRGATQVGATASTTFTEVGLTASTLYTYTVRAVDNAPAHNVSTASAAASATTLAVGGGDSTPPTTPANVTATAQSSSSILVSWSASTDASGIAAYRVFRDGGTNPVGTVTATNFTDAGLSPSTAYSYTVRAVDASASANVSALSSPASATTNAATAVSGLDSRPGNTSCLAGDAPSAGTLSLAINRVFPNVTLSDGVKLLQEPAGSQRWFAVQQGGLVRVWANNNTASATTFVNITSRVARLGTESGFLGMALHPNWPTDPRVFLSYNAGTSSNEVSRISEFRSTDGGTTLDATTENILMTVNQPDDNHKGGDIAFGPDGYLYIGFGDGGGANDIDPGHNSDMGNGQYRLTLLGKMLRIAVPAQAGQPYTIPSDNPYAGNARCNVNGTGAANCPEIWAYGMRNPWRWSFDLGTGDLWVGDVGQNAWEEVDKIVKGGNYGWRCREGAHASGNSCGSSPGPYLEPIAEYGHGAGLAITGGYVYRGSAIPALVGRYVFADYANGTLWTIPASTSPTLNVTNVAGLSTGYSVSSFGQGNDGELYIVDYTQGRIGKIVAGAGGGGGRTIPTLLSQTGCVVAASPQQPASGLIPYTPNAPFYSDGALKQRWLALPDGQQIVIENNNDFTFPIGSVLMKNFTLGTRLIETRLFMHHNDGSWAGYTYEWNAQGTDATRVIGGKSVTINGQTWDYPSEGQCLVCHTAVAGRTLGPEVGTFNSDIVYPATGRTANQLTTHNAIGTLTPLAPPPASAPVIPNPYGAVGTVGERARAYLHANCSNCHQPGGPTSVNLDFRYTTSLLGTNACDVAPSAGDLGITNARRIAIGDAARSVVVSRINRLDSFAMPPLARHTIDAAGVQLLTDWVNGLTSCN